MRYPWANIALLILLAGQLLTGVFGFTSGVQNRQWILWLHGIGAYAIVLVLLWKGAIILSAYAKKGRMVWWRTIFAAMAILIIAILLSGLAWTYYGPIYFLGFSLVTLHIFLAIGLTIPLIWHIWRYRWIVGRPEAGDRRAFLRFAGLGLGGLAIWRFTTLGRQNYALPGAARRFTGSYETGSHSGIFPQVSWIADNPPRVDLAEWQLVLGGAVDQQLNMTYDWLIDLAESDWPAILDCTGGWYSEQRWTGVPVAWLLMLAGVSREGRSVTFESISGYKRRFGLEESKAYLLATHVAGRPLSHGHGFPIRLVAPGQRGVNWVKWLGRIQVNTTGKYWQLPLPLR